MMNVETEGIFKLGVKWAADKKKNKKWTLKAKKIRKK